MKTFLSIHWIFGHLLASSLVILFVTLGFWQVDRLEQRRDYNALLESRLVAEPTPYESLRARFDLSAAPGEPQAAAYRRAIVRGRYDTPNEVLIRTRALDGQPGYHVLTPLVLEDGSALLVERGWVPYEHDSPPVAPATPPEGEVEITGIVRPAQPRPEGFMVARDPAEGRLKAVFWIDPLRLQAQVPHPLDNAYLQLVTQTPAQATPLPVRIPEPEITEGSHLSYALQWFSFALIGIIGYPLLLRKVATDTGAEEPPPPPQRVTGAAR